MTDRSLQRCVDIRGGAAGLADRGGGPSFKKGGCVPSIGGSHSLASLARFIWGY